MGMGADAQQGTAGRPAHVRWIAGGTGAGKSTLTRALHERFDLTVFDGDRAERRWLERCTPERHPYFTAMRDLPPGATIWVAEVRRQAEAHGLADSVLTIDGSLGIPDLAALAAERFRLGEAR
ncbi:MAG TPA: hypothetical protein VGX23_07085 [Actinocrinis sp.]|nr:hypothetical protein [Actinocrinis sp.]